MRTIISGGLNEKLTDERKEFLENLDPPITLVITGGQRGIYNDVELWALAKGLPFKLYNTKKRFGMRGFAIRNREMAWNADRIVLFGGGPRLDNLRMISRKCKLVIIEASI